MKIKRKRITEFMHKKKDLDEFLKHLEDVFGKVLEDMDTTDRPIDIGISVNVYPIAVLNTEAFCLKKQDKVPVDILETDKKIHAVVAMPGMDSGTIKLNCKGHILRITANNAETSMNEIIELPAVVIKSGMKARYENGILEVIFNKSKKQFKKE